MLSSIRRNREAHAFKIGDGVTTTLGMHGGPLDVASYVEEHTAVGSLGNYGATVFETPHLFPTTTSPFRESDTPEAGFPSSTPQLGLWDCRPSRKAAVAPTVTAPQPAMHANASTSVESSFIIPLHSRWVVDRLFGGYGEESGGGMRAGNQGPWKQGAMHTSTNTTRSWITSSGWRR